MAQATSEEAFLQGCKALAGAGLFLGEVESSSSRRIHHSAGKKPGSGSPLSLGPQAEELPSEVGEAVSFCMNET